LLLTRVITAVVALVVLVGTLFFAPSQAWSLLMLGVALLGCWEWSRLSKLGSRGQSIYLFLSGAMGAVFWLLHERDPGGAFAEAAARAFLCSSIFWILFAPAWLARHARPSAFACAITGWLVVWPTWFAFVVLRDASPWLLLAISAIVWIADVTAYFTGKAFGRRKLAPNISPGKTWAGVYGAFIGVTIYGVALALISRSQPLAFADLFRPGMAVTVIVVMLGLTALAIVGDLFESWMKRGVGLKDSSNLLPGHGGVLDRIDALTSTLPVAAWILSLQVIL
jgi:phosphatidate cytidylyltransferase